MKRRIFSLVIASVMVASLFVGCGKDDSKNENTVTTKVEESNTVSETAEMVEESNTTPETTEDGGEISESVFDVSETKVDLVDIPSCELNEETGEYIDLGYTDGRYYIDNNILYLEYRGVLESYYFSMKLPEYTSISVLHDGGYNKTVITSYVGSEDNKYMSIVISEPQFNYDGKLGETTEEEIREKTPSMNTFVYTTNENMETMIYDWSNETKYGVRVCKNEDRNYFYNFNLSTLYDTNNEPMIDSAEIMSIAESVTVIKDQEILKNFK